MSSFSFELHGSFALSAAHTSHQLLVQVARAACRASICAYKRKGEHKLTVRVCRSAQGSIKAAA
jgi:hypothetical protein